MKFIVLPCMRSAQQAWLRVHVAVPVATTHRGPVLHLRAAALPVLASPMYLSLKYIRLAAYCCEPEWMDRE